MATYLEKLKNLVTDKPAGSVLSKLSKVPFDRFDSTPGESFQENGVLQVPVSYERCLFRGAVEILTSEGERLWVVTDEESERLVPSGAIYFTAEEICRLQEVGREEAQEALRVKRVFGGEAEVQEVRSVPTKTQHVQFADSTSSLEVVDS